MMPSEPLSAADLTEGELRGAERAAVRLSPCHTTLCQLSALPGTNSWLARLQNLSVLGAGVFIDQAVDAGGFVYLEITSASGVFSRTLLTRIVHVSPWPDGGYLLGGEFLSKLSEDEVRLLVG